MNNESWFKNSDNQFSSFSWGGEETMHNIDPLNDSNQLVWQVRDFNGQSVIQTSHGKRKGSNESFHPVTKQLITEARIANSMQRMSLGQDSTDKPIPSPKSNSLSKGHDEGFEELDAFETDSENEDIVLDTSADNKSSQFPQFYVHDDLKKEFARIDNSILPKKIVKSINQSALALVLYEPIKNTLLKSFEQSHEKKDNAKRNNDDKSRTINCESVENFIPKVEGMELYSIEDEIMTE
ncbi:uncharacterized protein LOC100201987 isoform X3 [Hydra vulgaris]|uniref:Uncharacterized protein LOC100201987 isoform X3 n=1 Tax=Hydra vulgaris TaxID=6087 RepID=A0ABM4CGA1_HYDVU